MIKTNKATAKQAAFCESLAAKIGQDKFNTAFEKAAKLNSNKPRGNSETVTQAVRRLNKTAASKLIHFLLDVNAGDYVPTIDLTPKPTSYLHVTEPQKLDPVRVRVPNDLIN